MSILAAAAAAGDAITSIHVAWAGGLIAFGALVAFLLGVFRAGSVSGPMRPAPDTGVGGILVLIVVAFATWFGLQIVYGTARAIEHRMSGSSEPFSTATLTPTDYSILATIPYIMGFLVLALGDRFIKSTLPRELGWSLDQLPAGAGRSLLAMISVLPIMFGAGIVLEALYQTIGYEHPTEHELLTVLGKSRDPLTKLLIIGGATLLAPVFEEFLFRGHVQTLLFRAFSSRPRSPQGFQVVQGMPSSPAGMSDAPVAEATAPPQMPTAPPPPPFLSEPEPEPVRNASPAARWAAIAITSVLFAVLHPMWTWPLIFLLSLGLGYAYERTGNLWVPVTMHLVFNTFNTTVFLITRSL